MAKASAAPLLTSRRRGPGSDTRGVYKEIAAQRAMSVAAEAAKALYGESYPELVQAALKARLYHAPRNPARKTSKYKRKLGKRAALMGMLGSLEHDVKTSVAPRTYGFADEASSNLPAGAWRALLAVESAGASDSWMSLVQRLSEAVTVKIKSASQAERLLATRLSLLEGTSAPLRHIIQSRPELLARAAELERRTSFVVLPRLPGGRSFLRRPAGSDLRPYVLDAETRREITQVVQQAGARVVHEGRYAITVESSAEVASTIAGTKLCLKLVAAESFTAESASPSADLLHVQPLNGEARWSLDAVVDHIAFLPPPVPTAVSSSWPSFSEPFLTHEQIRQVLGAGAACAPWAGGDEAALDEAVKVAVIDTGCDSSHPIFSTAKGKVSFAATHAGPKPQDDKDGHGTAMAWSVLMTAPNAHVLAIAHGGKPDQAIDKALDNGAAVICCPWAIDYQGPGTYLESLINAAIDDGAIVLFGAGNGTQAWPGDMPSVISVGGVYVEPTLATRPSSYTSWYESQRYVGRLVPDVCGVSGDGPRGVFLPLPVPAMSPQDQDYASRHYPFGDHLSSTDGWVFASGSSAATAQVSGIVALLVQKARSAGQVIDQATVKNVLKNGSTALNILNNLLFQSSTGGPPVPIHPGTVNASTSLSMV